MKKILSVILCFFMLLVCIPVQTAEAAYSGKNYTGSDLLARRLDNLFAAYPPGSSYFTSTPGGKNHSGDKNAPCNRRGTGTGGYYGNMDRCGRFDGSYQCHAYAYYAQYILFGKTENGTVNSAVSGGNTIQYKKISNPTKEQIMQMPFGTHIKNTVPAHSVILLKCDAGSITYLDCNCLRYWSCAVHLHTVSWSSFFSLYGIGAAKITGYAQYPTADTYPKDKPYGKTPFVDIGYHWAKEWIEQAYTGGLTAGVSADRFEPDGNMTRAMFVQILYNIQGRPQAGTCSFTDVPTGIWYDKAVAWAHENGIVAGKGNNLFAPDDPLTRQEAAVILYNNRGKYGDQADTQPDSETDTGPDPEPEDTGESVQPGTEPPAESDAKPEKQPEAADNADTPAVSEEAPTSPHEDMPGNETAAEESAQEKLPEYEKGTAEDTEKIPDDTQLPEDTAQPGFYPLDILLSYTDGPLVSHWAREAMAWCVESGLIVGRTKTTLAPAGILTRAEAVVILLRL